MGNIPISTQQIGPGLGVSNLPMQSGAGAAGRALDEAASKAEEFLTRIAEQDAAVDGLNKLADFKVQQAKRLADLQTSVKTPEGFTPLALNDFDDAAKEFMSAVDNPRVQSFLETRLPDLRNTMAGSAVQWETTARQALRTQNFSASVDKMATMAQLNLQAYEGARVDVLSALEAGGFDPVDAGRLRTTGLSALARSAVFGELERNPQAMLERLTKGEFEDLDANARLQAVNAAQSEIKRREAEAKANAQLARQENLFAYQQWRQDDIVSRAETGRGVPPPTGLPMADMLTPLEAEKLATAQERADRLYAATSEMPSQTPAQQLATVESLKPQPGQAEFAAQQEIYEAAEKKRQQIKAAREADPAAYTRQTFTGVQQAWQKFEGEQTPGNLQAAIRSSLNAQAAIGVPAAARKPLPEQLATQYAESITGAVPEQAYKQMQGLAADLGPLWQAALNQMARKLPASYKIAATIEDPINASLLIQSSRQSLTSLKAAAGDSARGIRAEIESNEDVKALGQAFGMAGAQTAGEVVNAAEVLALGRQVTLGDADPVGNAIKAIVTDRYAFGYYNNRPFAVGSRKHRQSVNEIETGANIAVSTLDAAKIDLPALDPAVDRDVQARSYLQAVKRNGYWVTYPGGGGLRLMSERNVPVMSGNKPVQFTWDELLELNGRKLPASPRRVWDPNLRTRAAPPIGPASRNNDVQPRKNAAPVAPQPPAPRPDGPPAPVSLRGPTAAAGEPEVMSEVDMIAAGERQATEEAARRVKEQEAELARIRKELREIGRKRRENPDG